MIIGSKKFGVKVLAEGVSEKNLMDDIQKNDFLYRFIPDLNLTINTFNTTLNIRETPKKELVFSKINSTIGGRYRKDFSSTDVIVLAGYLLERLRQAMGIYTLHSSSVYKKDKAIVLLGNLTGLGKTSTALYLKYKCGFEIYSDEKCLINSNNNSVSGQTRRLFIEEKTNKALTLIAKNIKTSKFIEIPKTSEKNISFFVIPIIIEGLNKPNVVKYTEEQFKWTLYEELSKDIRLVNGMIFNMSIPIPSLDNEHISERRLKYVNDVVKKIPCYVVKGTLEGLSNKISKLFEN